MALRARLTPPREEKREWPWHQPEAKIVSASLMFTGDRRMEAEGYLSSGYGLRVRFQQAKTGWQPLSRLANIWQPNRLKGIIVSPEHGTPYLSATQVFDIRPTPRKWLSIDRTPSANKLFLSSGQIVVTRSGSVGRCTLAHEPHAKLMISDDLLRVDPIDDEQWGWIYACLRSPRTIAMMNSAQYGHIIKHLETSHLGDIPVPAIDGAVAKSFNDSVRKILQLRNESYELTLQAETRFETELGGHLPVAAEEAETGFTVRASAFRQARRRLEASWHTPIASTALQRIREHGQRVDSLDAVTNGVYWLTRFKRSFGKDGDGVPYMSADELFTVNPALTKRILVDPSVDHSQYYIKEDWIVMACSGQTYGLLGSALLASKRHERYFFSHDLIRVVPDASKIRPGYLLMALSHPRFGRPVLLREAYGTSIPHLEPSDVASFPIVRLDSSVEEEISEAIETAKRKRTEADDIEDEISEKATAIIDEFVAE